jgi:hypothetical protein
MLNNRRLLGFLSFLPPVAAFATIVVPFAIAIATESPWNATEPSSTETTGMWIAAAVMFLGLALGVGLVVLFAIHAGLRPQLDTASKVVWILLIIFVSPIAVPVYWLVVVRPEPVRPRLV